MENTDPQEKLPRLVIVGHKENLDEISKRYILGMDVAGAQTSKELPVIIIDDKNKGLDFKTIENEDASKTPQESFEKHLKKFNFEAREPIDWDFKTGKERRRERRAKEIKSKKRR